MINQLEHGFVAFSCCPERTFSSRFAQLALQLNARNQSTGRYSNGQSA